MIKWIAAFIGYEFARFPGAILGFILGAIVDNYIKRSRLQHQSGGYGGFNPFTGQSQAASLGDFEVNLLSLSSLIIKADGGVSQNELDYVRAYFVQTYGKQRANMAFRTFNQVIKNKGVDVAQISGYFRARTSYAMRLQILHFLFGVADADGNVSASELQVIQQIAGYLYVNSHDFESIKAMFFKSADEAYKILEIDENTSEAEVKKAYRKMVKKYHPDKLTDMDEAYRKGARQKFDKVQEAYDKIRKERGF